MAILDTKKQPKFMDTIRQLEGTFPHEPQKFLVTGY